MFTSKKGFIILAVIISLSLFGIFIHKNLFAQTQNQVGGLLIKNSQQIVGATSSLQFTNINGSTIFGELSSQVQKIGSLTASLAFKNQNGSGLNQQMYMKEDGDVVIGSWSKWQGYPGPMPGFYGAPPPVSGPPPRGGCCGSDRDVNLTDFKYDAFSDHDQSNARMKTRNIQLLEYNKPANMVMARAEMEQKYYDRILQLRPQYIQQGLSTVPLKPNYGPFHPVGISYNVGLIHWSPWQWDAFQTRVAQMTVHTEAAPSSTSNPGRIYFTPISSVSAGTDPRAHKMIIASSGYIGLLTLEPKARLDIRGDMKIENGRCTGCADVAEDYQSSQALEAGDVVMIDEGAQASVKKTSSVYEQKVVGVIASSPAMRISGNGAITLSNGDSSRKITGYPLALKGRVPVKVSGENGPIKPGDYLTSSSIPGVAMKATSNGPVIGRALTAYSGQQIGSVNLLIANGWYSSVN